MQTSKLLLTALTLATSVAAASVDADTIVSEDFSGTGSPLTGTSADVFGALGSGEWVANANFTDDGAFVSSGGENTSAYISLGQYVNDTKGTGEGLFELTVTFERTGGAWFGFGFSALTAPNVNNHFLNNTSTGTIIQRSNNELDVFTLANANGAGFAPNAGERTVTIALDLTDWDGATNFGSATYSDSVSGDLLTYEYLADADFESILLSGPQNASATISSLVLTQVPEPSSLALLGLGGLMMARRRRQA